MFKVFNNKVVFSRNGRDITLFHSPSLTLLSTLLVLRDLMESNES